MKKIIRTLVLIATLCFVCDAFAAERYIVIDKPTRKLYVIHERDTIFRAGVCLGAGYGNKQEVGDNRTPEGTFKVSMIHDSSAWTKDFGYGEVYCYGPWFIRLYMPEWHHHIGIHGTANPATIGSRRSQGCIRLKSNDIRKLKDLVKVGMKVIITPDFK